MVDRETAQAESGCASLILYTVRRYLVQHEFRPPEVRRARISKCMRDRMCFVVSQGGGVGRRVVGRGVPRPGVRDLWNLDGVGHDELSLRALF